MFYIQLCLEDEHVICINDFYHDNSVNKIWAILGKSTFNYLNIIGWMWVKVKEDYTCWSDW
jgi:hypothetical protein